MAFQTDTFDGVDFQEDAAAPTKPIRPLVFALPGNLWRNRSTDGGRQNLRDNSKTYEDLFFDGNH
jgi:hypothetical protein